MKPKNQQMMGFHRQFTATKQLKANTMKLLNKATSERTDRDTEQKQNAWFEGDNWGCLALATVTRRHRIPLRGGAGALWPHFGEGPPLARLTHCGKSC